MRNLGCKPPRRATVTSTRMDVTCGGGIITGLAVYAPAWTDSTPPRTDAPVRFQHGKRYVRSYFGTLEAVVPFSRIAR